MSNREGEGTYCRKSKEGHSNEREGGCNQPSFPCFRGFVAVSNRGEGDLWAQKTRFNVRKTKPTALCKCHHESHVTHLALRVLMHSLVKYDLEDGSTNFLVAS